MKKYNLPSSLFHKIYLFLIFLATLIILYFLFPRESKFKYEFQKGKPWLHETLIAPFNFAVIKTDTEIQIEKDSILKQYIPYFKLDTLIEKEQVNKFYTDFNNIWAHELISRNIDPIKDSVYWATLKTSLSKQVAGYLSETYQEGILEKSPENIPELQAKEDLVILKDKIARRVPKAQTLSLKKAYEFLNQLLKNDQIVIPKQLNGILTKINVENYLAPNLFYDNETSDRIKNELLANISSTRGMVQAGERIISRGDVVTGKTNQILESLKSAHERSHGNVMFYYMIIVGKVVLLILSLVFFYMYIYEVNKSFLRSKRNITFILALFIMMIGLASATVQLNLFSVYAIPLTIFPIVIRTFFNNRLAIFTNTTAAVLIGFFAPNSYEFVLLQFFAGTVAVLSLNKLHRRGHLLITAIYVFITYGIIYFANSAIQEGNFATIDWNPYKYFGANSVLILIGYLLIYVFEKLFGMVSSITLLELSDTNSPLLRELAEKAPGTFQHSTQVAALAEEAIIRIGGNIHLTRAGALYHDIGKTVDPQLFTENQTDGFNPHDEYSYTESATRIISHVEAGVKLAQKNKLPEMVIDFIRTHHGTTRANFFYLKTQEENPGVEIDPKPFEYPGPNPFSREMAVVMLADSIEAASRSLKKKDRESLSKLIDNIVDQKIQDHQLELTPLTFDNIHEIKQIFLNKLTNVYHSRIAYPKPKRTK